MSHVSGACRVCSENMTDKYPDLKQRMPSLLKAGTKSIVVDAEVVGWDVEKQQLRPFQVCAAHC